MKPSPMWRWRLSRASGVVARLICLPLNCAMPGMFASSNLKCGSVVCQYKRMGHCRSLMISIASFLVLKNLCLKVILPQISLLSPGFHLLGEKLL